MFTPDGRYLLVGNYLDQDFSIFKVDGTDVTDTGKRFKVPGHPASARGARAEGERQAAARVPIFVSYFRSGYLLTKPSRFGICTFGRLSAFITSLSPMILLSARM